MTYTESINYLLDVCQSIQPSPSGANLQNALNVLNDTAATQIQKEAQVEVINQLYLDGALGLDAFAPVNQINETVNPNLPSRPHG